jgi:tetratricopeptide (TPR) repeat protein
MSAASSPAKAAKTKKNSWFARSRQGDQVPLPAPTAAAAAAAGGGGAALLSLSNSQSIDVAPSSQSSRSDRSSIRKTLSWIGGLSSETPRTTTVSLLSSNEPTLSSTGVSSASSSLSERDRSSSYSHRERPKGLGASAADAVPLPTSVSVISASTASLTGQLSSVVSKYRDKLALPHELADAEDSRMRVTLTVVEACNLPHGSYVVHVSGAAKRVEKTDVRRATDRPRWLHTVELTDMPSPSNVRASTRAAMLRQLAAPSKAYVGSAVRRYSDLDLNEANRSKRLDGTEVPCERCQLRVARTRILLPDQQQRVLACCQCTDELGAPLPPFVGVDRFIQPRPEPSGSHSEELSIVIVLRTATLMKAHDVGVLELPLDYLYKQTDIDRWFVLDPPDGAASAAGDAASRPHIHVQCRLSRMVASFARPHLFDERRAAILATSVSIAGSGVDDLEPTTLTRISDAPRNESGRRQSAPLPSSSSSSASLQTASLTRSPARRPAPAAPGGERPEGGGKVFVDDDDDDDDTESASVSNLSPSMQDATDWRAMPEHDHVETLVRRFSPPPLNEPRFSAADTFVSDTDSSSDSSAPFGSPVRRHSSLVPSASGSDWPNSSSTSPASSPKFESLLPNDAEADVPPLVLTPIRSLASDRVRSSADAAAPPRSPAPLRSERRPSQQNLQSGYTVATMSDDEDAPPHDSEDSESNDNLGYLSVFDASLVSSSPPPAAAAKRPQRQRQQRAQQAHQPQQQQQAQPQQQQQQQHQPQQSSTAGNSPATTLRGAVMPLETAQLSNDWNRRFQAVIEQFRTLGSDRNADPWLQLTSNNELLHIAQDFLYSARSYGKIIISEAFLPDSEKTIRPVKLGGVAGGDKYVVHNILFKFALDRRNFYGSDSAASKVAGHELQGLISMFSCDEPGLCMPLMALVDYKGFRLIALSTLPIANSTLIYGTNDGGRTIHAGDDVLNQHLDVIAKQINVKPHQCGNAEQSVLMYSACDLEGHRGRDGKFYVVDFSRVMPPERPSGRKMEHLYRLLRPEFVKSYVVPLCSDGYSGFIRQTTTADAHNSELDAATEYLHTVHIPHALDEMLFAVQRFRERAGDHVLASDAGLGESADASRFFDAVRSGSGIFNGLGGSGSFSGGGGGGGTSGERAHDVHANGERPACLHLFKLTQLLHSHGINMRHAGRVLQLVRARLGDRKHRMQASELNDLQLLLMVEIVARCVKNQLRLLQRERMREIRVPLEQPYSKLVVDQLNVVLGRSSRSVQHWSGSLKALMVDAFSSKAGLTASELEPAHNLKASFVETAVRGEAHPLSLLFLRVTQCLGLRFEPRLIDELLRSAAPRRLETPQPFDEIDLLDIGDRVKHMNIVVMAQASMFKMQGKVARARDPVVARTYFQRSIAKFEEYLVSMPNNKLALINLAEALFYLQKEVQLEARALEREKNGVAADEKRRAALSLQRRANATFLQLVKLDPGDAASLFHYAKFLDRIDSLDDADEYYLHSMERDPNMVLCLREYGHFLTEKRQRQDLATRFYERARFIQQLILNGQRVFDVGKIAPVLC